MDYLREPTSAALGISVDQLADADLVKMYFAGDIIMGKMFEGYPLPYRFNESEMDAMMKLTAVKLNATIRG